LQAVLFRAENASARHGKVFFSCFNCVAGGPEISKTEPVPGLRQKGTSLFVDKMDSIPSGSHTNEIFCHHHPDLEYNN
jgi:hypothetical protein